MKLSHPKSWYQKNSEIEGDSEIGAGIPPWSRKEARKSAQVPSAAIWGTGLVRARQTPKTPRMRNAAHRAARALCHA